MSKRRVFELAKEFNTDSKVVLDILKRHNYKVNNNFSGVGEAEYEVVKQELQKSGKAAAQAPKKPEKDYSSQDGRVKTEKHDQPKEKAAAEKAQKPAQEKEERQMHREQQPVHSERKKEEPKKENHSEHRDHNDRNDRNERSERSGDRQGGGRDHKNDGKGGNSNGRDGRKGSGRSEKNERGGRKGDKNDRNGNNGFNNNDRRGGRKNKGNKRGGAPQPAPKAQIARPTHIKVGESIAVKDLASKMSYTAAEVIKKLFMMGVMATINQEIDYDTAALVAAEFGVACEELPPEVDPTLIPEIEDDPKSLKLRPPVVTVMGHVDHGKTSLLDAIRNTSVSTHEAGGITQHIGAYQVMCQGKKIVFLDTPGHEAFTAMRARGAQITDIAILVVAADDGVMPQTVEAINHAKSADVPVIVAINKIDKPGANPDRVKQELMEHGLVPEEYGGDTIMVPVSAKKRMGLDNLLEMVLLVAEVKELKANPNRDARGVIVEAKLDKGRGPVATVLVQNGTLRIGDSIVCGTTYGKVRAMVNDRGDNVKKAGPSVPVEILGLNDVPSAGDILAVLEEKQARSIAEARVERQRTKLIKAKKVSLDDLFQQIQEGEIKDLNIVVKADVQGSVEALNSSLLSLNKNDEVRVAIVHSGVGAVNESDVMLASASNALIIAFNVRPDANARKMADNENIDIRTYRVIYDALNDVKDAMSGMLKPKYKEVIQGRVEIRKVMKFSKALVAGSYVLDGKIFNNSKIRIIRDNIEIFDGEIDSLRRFKDEVKEVAAGYECGISIVDFRDFQEGDIIEAYTMEEIATSITEANKAAAKRREEQAKAAEAAKAENENK
ncbi:translation initiation factor IF-2 [Selenomonas sp. KH1T6]|uniref:translation initiation factor IF-2 n=1 Tax=Selenomonas sp. KH1T6 TaxID=3158784 RepID=UPI0008A7A305|nr:translation initiation factor IF-2 [Selenomonas ruminantium]